MSEPVDDFRKAFGVAVRQVREDRGVSQERLSDLAGLDRTYISGLERGTRNPTLVTQRHIADALGVDLSSLVALAEGQGD